MADPPVLTVLCADRRPPGMATVEAAAQVRYVQEPTLADGLRGADALLVWDFFSTAVRDAWPSADRLRWVHVASAGLDRLLFPDLARSSVVVTNSRGVFDQSIAEYVLGLVLAISKDLRTTFELQSERSWVHRDTRRIGGQHALVVGTGSIGRAIGRLLAAAGLVVTGVGRTARPQDPDLGVVHPVDDLSRLLPAADYVVVAAPLTESTRGMIGAEQLRRMRSSAWLLNVGRGEIVVEPDLLAALDRGEIAGAALDVFAEEPLPADHPLWARPDVIVSPHMSGDFVGWLDALAQLFVTNFHRWQAGEPLLNQVDKDAGYVVVP